LILVFIIPGIYKTKYKTIQQQQHTTNLNIKPFSSSILLIAAVDRT
jgi:hypothetical protein